VEQKIKTKQSFLALARAGAVFGRANALSCLKHDTVFKSRKINLILLKAGYTFAQ